jgi:yecA family protein
MNTLPSFDDVTEALGTINMNASQAHGLLCGLICVANEKENDSWKKLLFGSKKKPKNLTVIEELYENSYQQLTEFSFEFEMLLPDDEQDINFRTESLGLWCQGFLTGLKKSNIQLEHRQEGELTDTLDDLTEIAQVNFGDLADTDEEESAYFELVEYVRLAALLVFQELKTDAPRTSMDETNFLH